MALFVLHKLILQTRIWSHPVGLDVWFFVGAFVYFHTSCARIAKALARLRACAGSPWAFAGRLCDKYHNLMSLLNFVITSFTNFNLLELLLLKFTRGKKVKKHLVFLTSCLSWFEWLRTFKWYPSYYYIYAKIWLTWIENPIQKLKSPYLPTFKCSSFIHMFPTEIGLCVAKLIAYERGCLVTVERS